MQHLKWHLGQHSKPPLKRQHGATLVEGLLALAISVVMISALVYLLVDGQTEMRAKNEAQRLTAFQRVAAQYFTAERETLLGAMDASTQEEHEAAALACRIAVPASGEGGTPAYSSEKHTCMVDASFLRSRGLLPAGMSDTNAYGEKLIAIFRRIREKNEQGQWVLSDNVDMVVLPVLAEGLSYTQHESRHAENLSTASMMGSTGGVIPDRDRGNCKAERSSTTYEICGNGWRVQLGDFLTSDQLQAFSALLPQ
ncbi:PulJ/GspJ family protein [Comamonas composti]|uniref:PulJ/GspJ family protein n=1 Tax=Comamonas composti TaxID=408558 RepID=UPI0004115BFE|nr:type II secretion system protein [Comamonas composti]